MNSQSGPSSDTARRERKIIKALDGAIQTPPPIWMMRQAGRHLPEYRETRKQAGNFLDLCYSPEMACEVTLQPIRRYRFDAAILFSDILVIPDALGQKVRFEEGFGPRLEAIETQDVSMLSRERVLSHLEPVFQAVSTIRKSLSDETALLGFCGAPWTVATYMIAGHGTPDQAPARLAALADRTGFGRLIDLLVEVSIDYLAEQLRRGADAVQVFDTWAGVLSPEDFELYCLKPMTRIVEGVRSQISDARIIGFPKGAAMQLERYASETGINGIGIDWTVPLHQAKHLQRICTVQGNLDPLALIAGGKQMDVAIDRILDALSDGPFIFNLGHGITPKTPTENVSRMVDRVRSAGSR